MTTRYEYIMKSEYSAQHLLDLCQLMHKAAMYYTVNMLSDSGRASVSSSQQYLNSNNCMFMICNNTLMSYTL
jgi:hypothetical protein